MIFDEFYIVMNDDVQISLSRAVMS